MINLKKLKDKIAQLQRDKDRAEGALEQHYTRLRKEFQCDNLEEGQVLLKKLEEALATAEKESKKLLRAFEEQFGDMLEG